MAHGERGGDASSTTSAMNDVEAKMICAEQLLFRIAAALRRVPFEEHTKALHLQALQLKTELRELRARSQDAAACEAILEKLDALHARVARREWS